MAERSVIQSLSGAVLSISATLPATYDAAGYGATGVVFTAIGEVEDHGNHGVRATITEFTPVQTAIVAKVKGSKNYGTKSLMVGYVPGNAGQALIRTASESNLHYSVRVQYPVGDGETTGEIHYLDVLVASAENQDGTVDNIRRMAVELAICRPPVIVDAT